MILPKLKLLHVPITFVSFCFLHFEGLMLLDCSEKAELQQSKDSSTKSFPWCYRPNWRSVYNGITGINGIISCSV